MGVDGLTLRAVESAIMLQSNGGASRANHQRSEWDGEENQSSLLAGHHRLHIFSKDDKARARAFSS